MPDEPPHGVLRAVFVFCEKRSASRAEGLPGIIEKSGFAQKIIKTKCITYFSISH